jgi:hypothetical protein
MELRAQPVDCGVAPVSPATAQPNIFSEQQEMWLGQVEADLEEPDLRPVRDARLSEHVQGIADRLVATLPPTQIQFRVTLVDSDEINAISIAGGHIYILRKLAAAAQNDDELAGVIGHEVGHIVSHQFAFETTREMKRLLNVSSVGDEADIRTKYEAMLDAEYRNKHPALKGDDQDEAEADRIGVYAMSAAGYRPQAYAEFWNRAFFVGGETHSRMRDLLGLTTPSQKRLRSMDAMVAAIPPGCGKGVTPDEHEFAQWHAAVVADQAGTEVAQSAALREVTLTPPLRMELDRVRFSPDGRSLLAQDASSIFVLGRKPLALRYRIDASGALPANFSPDSQSVTFSTAGLHTEQWSVLEKKLLAAHEILPRAQCYDTRLSPDGRTLVCVEFDLEAWELGLAMLDTTTSQVLWEKKKWMTPYSGLAYSLLVARALRDNSPTFISSYSADGNTLLFAGGEEKIAFDLKQRYVIKTGWAIRGSITGDYAFVGNDRVAGANRPDVKNSAVYGFPEGKTLAKLAMPSTDVKAVSNPGTNLHLLIYGLKDYGVGLGDLSTGKFLVRESTQALDEEEGTIAGESAGGTLVVAQLGNGDPKQQEHLDLPISPLPFSPTAALSRDGKYLALSIGGRGGVWNLLDGKQVVLVHGFTDAAWTDEDTLYMDIAKYTGSERHIATLSMAANQLKNMSYKIDDETHMRYGRLTDWKMDPKKNSWALSLYNPADDKVMWSKNFPDRYFSYTASYGDRDLIFNFQLDSHTAKEAIKASAALATEARAIKNKTSARLIKVIDGKTGDEDGSLVVELPPNYADTDGLNRAGDLLYVAGVDDRTAAYSIATGKRVRDLIGYVMALDPETGRVFTANRVGEGVVYDGAGVELAHYQFGGPIRYALFREGGTLVTILTADQKVRTMKVVGAANGVRGEKQGIPMAAR